MVVPTLRVSTTKKSVFYANSTLKHPFYHHVLPTSPITIHIKLPRRSQALKYNPMLFRNLAGLPAES